MHQSWSESDMIKVLLQVQTRIPTMLGDLFSKLQNKRVIKMSIAWTQDWKLLWWNRAQLRPLYMTKDSPFWAIEGEVIPEVAKFEEEVLVTSEGWEGEKEIVKICCGSVSGAHFPKTAKEELKKGFNANW